jgi:hypothetical protein
MICELENVRKMKNEALLPELLKVLNPVTVIKLMHGVTSISKPVSNKKP